MPSQVMLPSMLPEGKWYPVPKTRYYGGPFGVHLQK